jgi:hypothetical protein
MQPFKNIIQLGTDKGKNTIWAKLIQCNNQAQEDAIGTDKENTIWAKLIYNVTIRLKRMQLHFGKSYSNLVLAFDTKKSRNRRI